MNVINIKDLSKEFYINEHKTFKDYFSFKKNKKVIKSVKNVSFEVNKGETVGLIGLNGAGKSTLIKMMTGILAPTSGEIKILGNEPFSSRLINNRKISTVFGQRCKLRWDISAMESYYLIKDMYNVSDKDFNERIEQLSLVLKLENIINKPVRTLSLGQKMKAELAGAFLYNPEIIFLDEPTIGLDILTKDSIYEFLDDIEKICDRVIVLHEGNIIHDSPAKDISKIYDKKLLEIVFNNVDKLKNKLDFKDYNYQLEDNIMRIDLSNVKSKSELIKNIYDRYEDLIDYVQVTKPSFKDSLKYFLNESLMGDKNEV